MRTVLFCEHKYAISILEPLQKEADRTGKHRVLWFVDARNIPDFSLKEEVRWTNDMQEIYDFSPEAIFVPGNIVPYYLSGVKAEIFHGYAAEKKDHWVIRRYLDMYLTQGPFFTTEFKRLANKYKDFEVVETGWSRQDWIFNNLHLYDDYKKQLLDQYKKNNIVLYAPTFSPSLTSLPFIKNELIRMAKEKDILLLFKFHPLTNQKWIDEYKQVAEEVENICWIDDHNITKYMLISDLMISDTSSTVYEFLLLNKPVITFRNVAREKYWADTDRPDQLVDWVDSIHDQDEYLDKRRWIIENYDPYLDGKVASRMYAAVEDYINRYGVPKERKLNLWRKYQSIKKFGKIKKN
jgi:Putative glycosyl/glycerophosphate transferases involved in teichoic acid biosynthesis TagF/TagB/EpsJ/RodC